MLALPNVTYEMSMQLKYISNNTKYLLHNTERKVVELEKILKQSHKHVDIHKDLSSTYKIKIKEDIGALTKMRENINRPCKDDCKTGKQAFIFSIF